VPHELWRCRVRAHPTIQHLIAAMDGELRQF
jgi:hypothetical protein